MSDNKDEEDIVPIGNEWEVVALTESAYAAAPGSDHGILESSHTDLVGDVNAETARAMIMSSHFGFSPITHESLLLAAKYKNELSGKGSNHVVPEVIVQPGGKSEDGLNIKGLIPDEFPGIANYDEKGNNLSLRSSDFGNVASLIEKEQGMQNMGKAGPYEREATRAAWSYKSGEGAKVAEPLDCLDHAANSGMSNVQNHIEEDKCSEPSNIASETWWRSFADSLYGHVKNTNPFCPIFVAVAVMGLVIISHRWQRERPQVLRLKEQLVIDDEGSGWMLGSITRLKDVTLSEINIVHSCVEY